MHPTILAKRKAEAVAKLVVAAEALAETLELDRELITGLHPVGVHDNLLREMLLLEGTSNLITAVAIQAGAIQEGVSMETPRAEEPEAHWVETTSPEAEQPFTEEAEFLSPGTAEDIPAEEKHAPSKKSTRKRPKK